MNTTEAPKKHCASNIIKLDCALKLAEKWVNHMTKAAEDDPTEEEESRPTRLGLGAKVPQQSKYVPSNDPLERKLFAKLGSHARVKAKSAEESARAARVECSNDNDDDDDEDEENLESRTNAFDKKRTAPQLAPSMQGKKKK